MDRTPRRSDFPRNVQEQYPSHFSTIPPAPEFAPTLEEPAARTEYDLQSYVAGLEELDIALPYELAPVSHSMSPFEELDFSEFLCPGNY